MTGSTHTRRAGVEARAGEGLTLAAAAPRALLCNWHIGASTAQPVFGYIIMGAEGGGGRGRPPFFQNRKLLYARKPNADQRSRRRQRWGLREAEISGVAAVCSLEPFACLRNVAN